MKRIILAHLLIIVCLNVTDTYAKDGQVWLDMNLTSTHIGRDYWWENKECRGNECTADEFNWQENNFGLGLLYGVNDYVDIAGGLIFKNSYNRQSLYGGVNVKYPFSIGGNGFRIEPGVIVAGATGYTDTPMKKRTVGNLLPYFMPNITLVLGDAFYYRIGFIPDIDGAPESRYDSSDRTGLITMQIGAKLAPW